MTIAEMTKTELLNEIAAHRPWYQRIEFPEFGISTTDDPDNAMLDAAWDNVVAGISLRDAALRRPRPKWDAIQPKIPAVAGLDVLEVGCNCGFFSFEFSKLGARSVTGLDVAPHWLENARWAGQVLGLANVQFKLTDFMLFNPTVDMADSGLLSNNDQNIQLPNDCYDFVFMSTVLDHLFFPLLAIYKMIRMSRQWVVIDVPHHGELNEERSLMTFQMPPDGSHHGFGTNQSFMTNYVQRLGIPKADISALPYNDAKNIVYIIDTRRKAPGLVGA